MISVLIVNWNTRDQLHDCLTSIFACPPNEPFEVLVVDNSSTDGSADMVRDRFPNVQLICPGRNTGYATGNNLAFAHAKGDLLLTLNPDTVVQSGTLSISAAELRSRADFGVLGIKLIGMEGEVQASVRGFPTAIGIFGAVTGLGSMFPGSILDSYRLSNFNYSVTQPAPQPMGTFYSLRRKLLRPSETHRDRSTRRFRFL